MLTYVINTSENKTFESSLLFELTGYNKMRWLHCSLDEINKCAEEISEKQNILGADRFRIAVIVDFYGFDKIRVPYARRGFEPDTGVDISLYVPYIEAYLLDNLIVHLEKKDLYTSDFDIYYVQNDKTENYELFDNAKSQLELVMSGIDGVQRLVDVPKPEEEEEFEINADGERVEKKKTEKEKEPEEPEKMLITEYPAFRLYCTPGVALEFKLKDYPYGEERMTFDRFWVAFRERMTHKADLRRHYYLTSYGGGPSRAALDTLSLSLYLIRVFEREEEIKSEGNMDVIHLDSVALKNVLEASWNKVNSAKAIAKKTSMQYYALDQISKEAEPEADIDPEETLEYAIFREREALPKEITKPSLAAIDLYRHIDMFAKRRHGDIEERNRKEFDEIMGEYLRKRDDTRAADIEEEFLSLKAGGFLKHTDRCPSREEYEHIIELKEKEIADTFDRALSAGYIEVDYDTEKEVADEAYMAYKKAATCLERNLIGDVIFLILSVISMIIPYSEFQLSSYTVGKFSAAALGLMAAGAFAGVFVLAVILRTIPEARKLKAAKKKLQQCYINCCAKERYSFSAIRRKFERDLIEIEQTRYEIRQVKNLYNANLEKDKNVSMHHEMLERLDDCLASILNNLQIEPVVGPAEPLDGEFDVSKPFRARENKVYHIFSIETIEKMFPKKGSD